MRALYRPLGMAMSVLGGLLASWIFKTMWKGIAREEEAPSATEHGRSLKEVLLVATLQGAVFGLVKAAVESRRRDGLREGNWDLAGLTLRFV